METKYAGVGDHGTLRSRMWLIICIGIVIVALSGAAVTYFKYHVTSEAREHQEQTLAPAPLETDLSDESQSTPVTTSEQPVTSESTSIDAISPSQSSSAGSPSSRTTGRPHPTTTKESPAPKTSQPAKTKTHDKSTASKPTPMMTQPTIAAADPTKMVFSCEAKPLVTTPVLGMTYGDGVSGGEIHPPTGHEAYYLSNFGVLPSSPGDDSTFIFGHSWVEDDAEVFNPISERAFAGRREAKDPKQRTKPGIPGYADAIPVQVIPSLVGCTVTVKTENGTFTYKTTEAFTVAKDQFQYVGDLAGTHGLSAGRLVVATCLIDKPNMLRLAWNVVIYATQVSATR